jgi:hypothetical protein
MLIKTLKIKRRAQRVADAEMWYIDGVVVEGK